MRYRLVLMIVASASAISVGLAVAHTNATASSAGDPRIAKLEAQVKTLQSQYTRLKNQVNWNWDGDTCLAAMTADLIQGTWVAVDQATQKSIFGAQTQVPEYGSCGRMINPKVPRTTPIAVPPSISELLPLLQWLSS